MIYLAVTLLFLCLVAVVLLGIHVASLLRQPPYIPLPPAAVEAAITALELAPSDRLVDLGSGDGRVMFAAARRHSGVECLGIEIGLWPRWIFQLRWRWAGRPKGVRTIKADFFRADLSSYNKVFTYLFPWALAKLLPKLQKELKPGTLLVSADYRFPEKEPERVISLSQDKKTRGRTLFVYKF